MSPRVVLIAVVPYRGLVSSVKDVFGVLQRH